MPKNDYKPSWTGLDRNETRTAKKKFEEYLQDSHIESISDLDLLTELVKKEQLQERIWKQTEDIQKKTAGIDGKPIIPKSIQSALNENLEQIISLKDRLGLSKKEKQLGFEETWGSIQKKLETYAKENSGEFEWKCPKCNNWFLLCLKIDDYNTFDFTMFKGTYLYNEEMFKDVYEGKLKLEDVARYWGQPLTDYVKGIYEKVYLKEREAQERLTNEKK